MEVSGFISAIIVGLIIGALGRLVLPGRQNIGIWLTLLIGIVITFFTLHSLSFTGYKASPGDGQRWGNLGVGGFVAMIVFALFGAGALQVLLGGPRTMTVKDWAKEMPVTSMVLKVRKSARAKSFVVLGLALALFYPPMLTVTWQNVLVTQVGETVLLAIGSARIGLWWGSGMSRIVR